MDRFVENYIKGVRTFKLEIDPDNESGKTYFAKSTNYESEYEMRNRQCGCQEYEKTGVACPHLILLAIKDKQRKYDDLISPKWIKYCQTNQEKM